MAEPVSISVTVLVASVSGVAGFMAAGMKIMWDALWTRLNAAVDSEREMAVRYAEATAAWQQTLERALAALEARSDGKKVRGE